LLELLRPYGILEMVRTGIVAMRRGSKSAGAPSRANGAARLDSESASPTNDDVSYSV
jgi:hypothetical protein